jgi:hypothetical protein
MNKPAGSLKTTWAVRPYDVWGNPKDGYEVNNVHPCGTVELRIPQTRCNAGTPQEFVSAYPTNAQIKRVFGVRWHIDVDGDDLTIYVNRRRDSYPLGEMHCVSHSSLSPIREADNG